MVVMQVSTINWLVTNPEIGWVAVIVYLFWEIRGPKGKIRELTKSINSLKVVTRALARANEDVYTEDVDEHLENGGTEPSDFIRDKPDEDRGEVEKEDPAVKE